MVACFFDVISHHIFKRQHPVHIHVSRTGDQILFVGIFRCQLIADQMAAIMKIFAVYKIVFYCMPAARFYFSNRTAFFRWHQIFSDI